MTDEEQARKIAGKLSYGCRQALLTLPLPRPANPAQWEAARPFSSIWRKSAAFWDELHTLERMGIVERKVSGGETLWRPTRSLGLAVRTILE